MYMYGYENKIFKEERTLKIEQNKLMKRSISESFANRY